MSTSQCLFILWSRFFSFCWFSFLYTYLCMCVCMHYLSTTKKVPDVVARRFVPQLQSLTSFLYFFSRVWLLPWSLNPQKRLCKTFSSLLPQFFWILTLLFQHWLHRWRMLSRTICAISLGDHWHKCVCPSSLSCLKQLTVPMFAVATWKCC